MIAYVSIGNSDDKLPQHDWAKFQIDLQSTLHAAGGYFHGEWYSSPNSIFQNHCICLEIDDDAVPELQGQLAALAVEYRQDAICWAPATSTQFLGPQSDLINHNNAARWAGRDLKDVS